MKNYVCSLIWFCVLVLSCGLAHSQNILENVKNYDWAADFDPRVTAINAPKGALLKFAPTVGVPALLQKQDGGSTTNWTVVAGGGGGGTVTRVATGTGLIGGPITTTGTVSMGTTGVVAGNYGSSGFFPTFTVNAQGQLTTAGSLAVSGAFANQALSNLTSPTSINQILTFNQLATIDGTTSPALSLATAADGGSSINSGAINILSGNVTVDGNNSGSISIITGNIGAAGNAVGDINLQTGNAHSNNGGSIILNTGIGASKGTIQFQDGSQGTPGQIWTSTDPSGSGAWRPAGSFANQQLSNLSAGSVAINTSLVFGAGVPGNVSTPNAIGSPSQGISILTGTADGFNATGGINLQTGRPSLGTSGDISFLTGQAVQAVGNINLTTGLSSGTGTPSGSINLTTGNAVAGPSGDVVIGIGTGSPNGHIKFQDGSQGTIGQVWTSTGTLGEGSWAPAPATGVTNVATGTGLIGGPITNTGTISIGTTGVVAGSYGTTGFFPTFTVNSQGQLTSAGSLAVGSFLTSAASPLSTSGGTVSLTGTVGAANGGSPPTTRNLYVDNGRTDSFTSDGSWARPFVHVMDAVNQIITNADNGANPYTVTILPGTYSETLSFNSALLFNVAFVTQGNFSSTSNPGGIVTITNTGGNVIQSTSNNTQLANLTFTGITFSGAIVLTGDVNTTNFASTQVLFDNCYLGLNASGIALTNINNVYFYNSSLQGGGAVMTWQNVAFAYLQGVEGLQSSTTLHLVQNNGANQPSQSTGNFMLCSESKVQGVLTVDAGSEMDAIQCYFSSVSNITNNGTIHSFKSSWNGTTTLNAGSSTRLRDDTFLNNPVLNGGAVTTNQGNTFLGRLTVGASATPATNALIVTKDGHYKSAQTTAPTTTVNANAGTGATCSVTNATDNAGTVTLVTGSAAFASGVQCSINFNLAYNVNPSCVFTPNNVNAALKSVTQSIFFTSSTSAGIVNFGTAELAATTYVWDYHCIETQ